MNTELKDESPMPYGKYKDMPMKDVPASYLIWLIDNKKCSGAVKRYIEDNMNALKLELKNQDYE